MDLPLTTVSHLKPQSPIPVLTGLDVSQKNPRDYVFDDNLNSKRPIVIIFGTVIT